MRNMLGLGSVVDRAGDGGVAAEKLRSMMVPP
jgi:hypothetical protein